jgi:hypothetical protein
MSVKLTNLLKSSKGVSIITIIIFAAILVAALNAYAYFNPDFPLSKYTVNYFLGSYNDRVRKADMEKLRVAVEQYYDDFDEYPARDDYCGRIVSILHPEIKNHINSYFENKAIPQDPAFRGTNKDYFYRREEKDDYVLMAVLESPPTDAQHYNFAGCHDWPGDDVYNYAIFGSR